MSEREIVADDAQTRKNLAGGSAQEDHTMSADRPANPWAPLPKNSRARETLERPSQSFAQRAFATFIRKPSAIAGVIIVLIMSVLAGFGPALSPHNYDAQRLDFVNLPPAMNTYEFDGRYFYATPNLKVVEVSAEGNLIGSLDGGIEDPVKKRFTYELDNGQTLTLDYRAKPAELLGNGDLLTDTHFVWNADHKLGTDGLGRDILTRLMYGMRISLLIAVIAMSVNLLIGVAYGGISGYLGGNTDSTMMRIVDIVSTIPLILYVVLIQVMLTNSSGFTAIVIALSTVYWVDMARVVRGQVLSVKEQEFVAAARTMGTPGARILGKHIIPHVTGSIVVTATMLIPSAIFIEAFMSFIGLGVAPPMASLGTMSNDALATLRTSPYQLFIPAGAICVLMFAFNFIGDGLRDALDPKYGR